MLAGFVLKAIPANCESLPIGPWGRRPQPIAVARICRSQMLLRLVKDEFTEKAQKLFDVIMISIQEQILKDIDKLGIGYQIKLTPSKNIDLRQYFYVFSLDSHYNNQLFLNSAESVTVSGIALSKQFSIKEVNLTEKNLKCLGKSKCPSPVLGQKFPEIEGSSHARWKCFVKLNNQEQDFELKIVFNHGQELLWGKISFQKINFSFLNIDKLDKKNKKLINKLNQFKNSRQAMAKALSENKNYLFVIGNPRSGTTALGKLLNFSPEICLGIERYLIKDDVSALSFEKEVFFDVNSHGYSLRPHIYEGIKDKFDSAKYIGDKRPGFVKFWKNTFLNIPQAKIIYIVRNIYDVACSYNVRAKNASQGLDKQWQASKNFSEAVKEWNEGIQEVQNLVEFYQVYFVKYEDFFVNQSKMIELFKYLGVTTENQSIKKGIKNIYKNALSVQKRERKLSDNEQEYIDANANFEVYNKLLSLYEQQFK
ncbi:MAG: sulfotransferase [Xenococcaceae cyanobacterium MO_167.B52]|nr:sulfotransferase [Xenococcaceae cyanobacterium MO_167.B52]